MHDGERKKHREVFSEYYDEPLIAAASPSYAFRLDRYGADSWPGMSVRQQAV